MIILLFNYSASNHFHQQPDIWDTLPRKRDETHKKAKKLNHKRFQDKAGFQPSWRCLIDISIVYVRL